MKPTMNKKDLIVALSHVNGQTQEKNKSFIDDLMAVAEAQLKNNGTFAIHDLVRLDGVEKAARSGESMGVKWHKPAHMALKAKIIGKAKRMFQEG
jgi:nucleoid DNA-binding protein